MFRRNRMGEENSNFDRIDRIARKRVSRLNGNLVDLINHV